MALWSNLSAHMNNQNWKWFFSKDYNQTEEYFLGRVSLTKILFFLFNIIVAIKQLRVALFPWQLLIHSSFQSQGSMPAVCSTGVLQVIPAAIGSQLGSRMGSGPQQVTTDRGLFILHIVFSCHVPKWQRLRSTVLKYIMKPTYILLNFIAFSFLSKLSASITHSVTTIIITTEQVGSVISLESESKLSGVQYIRLSLLSHVSFATSGCRYTSSCVYMENSSHWGFHCTSTAELYPSTHCSPFWWASTSPTIPAALFILHMHSCLCGVWLAYIV